MISEAALAHWQQVVPWADPAQVEQDLVLTRMIVEIARHPELRDELVFRGGTCFHKLWLDRPWRYSEDLDYVRRSAVTLRDEDDWAPIADERRVSIDQAIVGARKIPLPLRLRGQLGSRHRRRADPHEPRGRPRRQRRPRRRQRDRRSGLHRRAPGLSP